MGGAGWVFDLVLCRLVRWMGHRDRLGEEEC